VALRSGSFTPFPRTSAKARLPSPLFFTLLSHLLLFSRLPPSLPLAFFFLSRTKTWCLPLLSFQLWGFFFPAPVDDLSTVLIQSSPGPPPPRSPPPFFEDSPHPFLVGLETRFLIPARNSAKGTVPAHPPGQFLWFSLAAYSPVPSSRPFPKTPSISLFYRPLRTASKFLPGHPPIFPLIGDRAGISPCFADGRRMSGDPPFLPVVPPHVSLAAPLSLLSDGDLLGAGVIGRFPMTGLRRFSVRFSNDLGSGKGANCVPGREVSLFARIPLDRAAQLLPIILSPERLRFRPGPTRANPFFSGRVQVHRKGVVFFMLSSFSCPRPLVD